MSKEVRAMADRAVVKREEWQEARQKLLEEERAHAARSEELAQRLKDLPWVQVDEEYALDTDEGMSENPTSIAFAREDGAVYHTYTRSAPDRDLVAPYYGQLLDMTPKGRVDEFQAIGHDEYEDE